MAKQIFLVAMEIESTEQRMDPTEVATFLAQKLNVGGHGAWYTVHDLSVYAEKLADEMGGAEIIRDFRVSQREI